MLGTVFTEHFLTGITPPPCVSRGESSVLAHSCDGLGWGQPSSPQLCFPGTALFSRKHMCRGKYILRVPRRDGSSPAVAWPLPRAHSFFRVVLPQGLTSGSGWHSCQLSTDVDKTCFSNSLASFLNLARFVPQLLHVPTEVRQVFGP